MHTPVTYIGYLRAASDLVRGDLLAAIKDDLDPADAMNPGKVLEMG